MFKKICLIPIIMYCIASFSFAADISAKSAVVLETSGNTVLYQKDMHTRREMASTTKIMTAVLVLENAEESDIVEIKSENTGIEGTSLYLKPGEKISIRTLLHGLMLQSGNDAASALAHYVGGSEERFVQMMNDKAAQLGMLNTHFKNPHGLPDDEHYSTAYDMALLTSYALTVDGFSGIVSKKTFSEEGKNFVNHNKLLRMSERIDGVKTGFTKRAGRCLVSSASEDGVQLVVVTLSASDDWNDHMELYDKFFSEYAREIMLNKDSCISHIPVIGGTKNRIEAVVLDELGIVLPKGDANDIRLTVHLPRFIYAPVLPGEKIGEAFLIHEGKIHSSTDIICTEEVEMARKLTIKEKIGSFFNGIFNVKQ